MDQAPVIIAGMHRSGTSLVTRCLAHMGLFVGALKDPNHEAYFFANLNHWLMQQCGGSWDHPEPFRRLLEHEAARGRAGEVLRALLRSPRAAAYTGLVRYLRGRTPLRMREPWGWKDPRNTFTLPLWLDLFPQAKVVYVERHGVDVARSLQLRAERRLTEKESGRIRLARWVLPRPPVFIQSLRCLDVNEGVRLWTTYMREAATHRQRLGERFHALRFESFLDDPAGHLRALADHCGLTVSGARIESLGDLARPERSLAHAKDPDLVALRDRFGESLSEFGYDGVGRDPAR